MYPSIYLDIKIFHSIPSTFSTSGAKCLFKKKKKQNLHTNITFNCQINQLGQGDHKNLLRIVNDKNDSNCQLCPSYVLIFFPQRVLKENNDQPFNDPRVIWCPCICICQRTSFPTSWISRQEASELYLQVLPNGHNKPFDLPGGKASATPSFRDSCWWRAIS